MTKDDFDYFTDAQMEWTGILNYYKQPSFENKKGTHFCIEIDLDKEIDSDDKSILTSLGRSWTWGEDRRLKAFKLLDIEIDNRKILYILVTMRKSKKYDEIKYFLYDVGSFLDLCKYKLKNINVNEIL